MTNSDLPSSLRYSNDNMAGYHRETNGDTFVYADDDRIKVKDQKTLKRINELVIPPMWQNVWICNVLSCLDTKFLDTNLEINMFRSTLRTSMIT